MCDLVSWPAELFLFVRKLAYGNRGVGWMNGMDLLLRYHDNVEKKVVFPFLVTLAVVACAESFEICGLVGGSI